MCQFVANDSGYCRANSQRDLCEIKSGAIGRREREIPTRPRLYDAENIGGTAELVLIVESCFLSALSRRGGANKRSRTGRVGLRAFDS